jgi:hypothetical protein
MRFRELATGESGYKELEEELLDVFEEAYHLWCEKQRSYGPGNIAASGAPGVVLRTNDKLQRLMNVFFKGGLETISGEGIDDTFLDILNYGAIGYLCWHDLWPDVDNSAGIEQAREALRFYADLKYNHKMELPPDVAEKALEALG